MGGFRRFVLFVFTLAGAVCLAALALPWFGVGASQLAALERHEAYFIFVEVCMAMTVAWLAYNLLRCLFSRRRVASVEVMDIDGGKVTVAKSAIASQAAHVVADSGLGASKGVEVLAKKAGPVNVTVRIAPFDFIDVTSEAPALHEALETGLGAMCGDRLGTIDVEFLAPRGAGSYDELDDEYEDYDEGPSVAKAASAGPADSQAADAAAPGDPDGITILMHADRED